MDYTKIISACEESKHLISMVPIERIVELGYNIGLDEKASVLDLCCGYGEMLKIWNEAFGIAGVGVDREIEFIETGRKRIANNRVNLIAGDVFAYSAAKKYDVAVCTEPLGSIADVLALLGKHGKPGGKLVFGRLFSKTPNPPKELIDFDGELLTLNEIYEDVRQCGYYITAMASDTAAEWERYIMWSAKRDLARLRQEPENKKLAAWLDKWYHMYFAFRRLYEGWGLFAVERL